MTKLKDINQSGLVAILKRCGGDLRKRPAASAKQLLPNLLDWTGGVAQLKWVTEDNHFQINLTIKRTPEWRQELMLDKNKRKGERR